MKKPAFEDVEPLPETAERILKVIGVGTWTAGYLCNQAVGSLVPVFGTVTLTAKSTPAYSNIAPLTTRGPGGHDHR